MRCAAGEYQLYNADAAGTLKMQLSVFHVFVFSCVEFRVQFGSWIRCRSRGRTGKSIVGSEPAAAEEEAGAEGGEKDRPAFAAWLSRGGLQTGVECRAAHGRAEIAGSFSDGRKNFGGNTALFCEESNKTRIRLMRGKTSDVSSRDAAAQLHGGEHFFHARDGGARKGFAVELHVEASVSGTRDLDRGSVVACTAK